MTVNIETINISDHAVKRYKERFFSQHEQPKNIEAIKQIKSILKHATYYGKVIGEDGLIGELFIYKCAKLIVRNNEVVTVIKGNEHKYEPLKKKLLNVYRTELNKLTRKGVSKEKYLENLKHEAEVEIAELKLRRYRTKSETVKMACTARIEAIKKTIEEYEKELEQIYKDKNYISRFVINVS